MNELGGELEAGPAAEEPWPLPKGWAWAKLGTLGIWTGSGTPSKAVDAYWRNGSIPWVSPKDMKSDIIVDTEDHITEPAVQASATKFVSPHSILMVMRSGILRHTFPVAVNNGRVTLNQDLRALTPATGIDPYFIANYLRSIQRALLHDCSKDGTTVQSVDVSSLERVRVPIAPMPEQRRIVARVDELFAEITEGEAALERARNGLDTWRRALLKAAVTGELTRDWREVNKPTETGADLVEIIRARREAAGIKAGRARRTEDARTLDITTLPILPENWAWASIGDIFEVYTGSTPSRSDPAFWGGDIPWVSSGEVAFCRIRKTRECVTAEGLGNSLNRIHPPGTVLLAMIGEGKTRGQCAILDIAACNNQNAAAIRVSKTPIDPTFIYFILQERYFRSRQESQGGNQPALNAQKVSAMVIPLPPKEEIDEIVRQLNDALIESEVTERLHSEADFLTMQLRQSILKSAFEGRLVPQDANDQPASVLLARLRAENSATAPARHARGRKSAP
jgi:type I restriction enzyme S subunit